MRAKHLRVAVDRMRGMKPVMVVIAPDVASEDVVVLERVADEEATRLVHLAAL